LIHCRTLGPVELTVGDAPAPPELLWRKHLALLIYLARSPKGTRTREHLIGLLWADKPEAAARHSLNEGLRLIRRGGGETTIDSEAGMVRLMPGAVLLDTELLTAALGKRDWAAGAALVAGEFLEGFGIPGTQSFEDWLTTERTWWRERSVAVLVGRAEELGGRGDLEGATAAAHRALSLDATSDVAIRAILRSLTLAGHRARALAHYESFVAHLRETVNAAPEAETQALAERIRQQKVGRIPPTSQVVGPLEQADVPLVGREGPLGTLLDLIRASREGRRAMVGILEGDPGIGKSRLLEETLDRVRLDGGTVAVVRMVEADLEEGGGGLLTLCRGGLLVASGLSGAPAPAIAAIAALAPEWAERFPGAAAGPEPWPLVRAFSEVVRAAAEEQPLVLAIDDAHWLDRESLLALGALARDLARYPITILLAVEAVPPRAEIDDFRARLGHDLPGKIVSLSRLNAEELRQLARWALPTFSEVEVERLARRVATDAAGLPLLVVELLRAVAAGLDLQVLQGAWPQPFRTLTDTRPFDLPDAVVAAIRVGFRRVSPAAQRALVAAAALGDRVDVETLEKASEMGRGDLETALDELEWHRWLSHEPRGYSFVARIVREVIEQDMMTGGQRQRILERAGVQTISRPT